MILLAKFALAVTTTVAVAGVYTFREGVIRVDVDEHHEGGSHVHFWLPAAAVPAALHFAPKHHIAHAADKAREFLPIARTLIHELEKYPNADFVDVQDGEDHVQIRTRNGKLQIDVHESDDTVHVLVPLSTLEDVSVQLENQIPTA
jgi:hypothetical protein